MNLPMHQNPYQSLVSLLSNILEAYTTAFFIVDLKNRQLKMAAAQSLSKYITENVTLPLEQSGILSHVHKVGQIVHMDKLQEGSSGLSATLPFYRGGESHIKGLFAVPVGDGVGVLYVDTKYSWGFNDKQQKWIREIAGMLHELVKRQDCLRQQKDYAHILDLWHKIDEITLKGSTFEDFCQFVVNEAAGFLGAEYAFLAHREGGDQHYRLLAGTPNIPRNLLSQHLLLKQGLVGWIFQNQKPLLIGRLNPQTGDHFLFSPSEALPHYGTFWALPIQLCLGHAVTLGFLTRQTTEWTADDQFAILHLINFVRSLLNQMYFQETCEHLQAYDLNTGVYNALAFEAKMDGMLADCMRTSTQLTLTLVQFEPWQILTTKATPRQLRQWQSELTSVICEALPADVLVGQITENRFGLLFQGMSPQEAKHHLNYLADPKLGLLSGKVKGVRVQPYISSVGFPQDGTRSDELWPLACRQLFSTFRMRGDKTGP